MYTIPWGNCETKSKNTAIADIGDIRLILAKHPAAWSLSMGIRVYTKDKSNSMVRPPVSVLQIPLPCEFDEAKIIAQEYFDNFLSSVLAVSAPN